MQYFIGVVPPEEIKNEIVAFQDSFETNKISGFVEPHITVKAQGGLTLDLEWLNRVKEAMEVVGYFSIRLKEVGAFGDKVVFLVPEASKDLFDLHTTLVSAVNPSEDEIQRYFEGTNYHPHLTLAGTGNKEWSISPEAFSEVKKEAEQKLLDLPEFEVTFIRIYRQEKDGNPYEKFLDIPLNG